MFALILLGLHIRQIIKCCGLTFNLWHSVILPGLAAVAGSFVSIGFYKFLLGTLAMPPSDFIYHCLWHIGCHLRDDSGLFSQINISH